MGIMANTASIYQYTIKGNLPETGTDEWIARCLMENKFIPIDDVPDEESIGWLRLDNPMSSYLSDACAFRHDSYIAITLRRDQRKVPAALVKNLVAKECETWLAERPKLSRVPVKRKTEIRENVTASLLGKTLPVPAYWDLLWNIDTGVVTISSISTKILDMIEDQFSTTFDGLSLVPIHPMSRATRVLDDELTAALEKHDNAPTKDVLSQIKYNRWLGWDFLLWMMFRTSNSSSKYEINQEGPAQKGEVFFAYLHDRFVLVDEDEEGIRKSSIIGPQNDFAEARKAMQDGKNIVEGILYFEKDEEKWKLNLKSDIFSFGSYNCPKVQIEKDEITDPAAEKEAVFYERMNVLETGLQLFDSLFAEFLKDRLSNDWEKRLDSIKAWISEE